MPARYIASTDPSDGGLASTDFKLILKERINMDQINRPTKANLFLGH